MPYLGKSPQHGNYSKLDDFSGDFDGSDATHAIASNTIAITPVRPEALLIYINGVAQEPGTDYTVSGTNITFTTAPTAGDNFFGIAMGEQLQIGTPSDATITSAKLSGDLTLPGKLTAAGDTAAGDNASIGYTAAEGLILTGQGSTNDVTIKNDADAAVISVPTGTTNVTVAGDLTVSGTAKGFGWIYLESATASSSATLEFDDIDTTYDRYMFTLENIIPATDGQNFNIRISTDNGSSFISSSSYSILRQRMGTEGHLDETGQSTIFSSFTTIGNQSSEGLSGTIYLFSPGDSARKPMVQGHVFGFTTGDALTSTELVGIYNAAADMDAIQFYFGSGNIASGTIHRYGLSKS